MLWFSKSLNKIFRAGVGEILRFKFSFISIFLIILIFLIMIREITITVKFAPGRGHL